MLNSHYFLDDDAQAYLIFDVLKTESIDVTATDDRGTELKVDVPQIQGVVGADVGVKASGSSQTTVKYSGKVPVSFGFRAFAINFVNGKWTLEGAEASGAIAFAAVAETDRPADPADMQPVLLQSARFLNMK